MAKRALHAKELYQDETTGDLYQLNPDGTYTQISASGAAYTNQQGGVWDYGTWPSSYYLPVTGAAGTNDNDIVYTSGDVSTYNTHYIECTAGTVDIQVSLDGTNFNNTQAAVLLHDDVTTGGGVKILTIASGKVGILKGKFKKIKVLQNGATASNARIAHTWE